MEKTLRVSNRDIHYFVRKSRRARSMRLSINPSRGVVVSLPFYMPYKVADLFVLRHAEWIEKHTKNYRSLPIRSEAENRKVYLKYKEKARSLVNQRIEHFNQFYGFKYNRISIRDQATRWGSCSTRKNLNFSYKLALIAPELADYVIVHELCHLKQMNHSDRFWSLVAETIPNYKQLRKKLRSQGPFMVQ